MDKFKFSTEHSIKIAAPDLRKILMEALNLPDNVVLEFSKVQRSNSRDSYTWTEITGVQLTYKS